MVGGGSAQGLVNFINTPTSLISVSSLDGTTAISGARGSYYFALLTAESGTTQLNVFQFSGLYATNQNVAGRIYGGMGVAVPGWLPGTARSFLVFGWPATEGPVFNPAWLNGVLLPEFGISMIGTGIAGGLDPNTGEMAPPLPVFGSSTINFGFPILWQCLSCNPPQIMIQPQDQYASQGAVAQFSIGAVLTPFLSYQWFCNDLLISGPTSSVLELTNVAATQNGNVYYAIASNPWGTARSASARLYVAPVVHRVPGLRVAGQPGVALEIRQANALGDLSLWGTWQSGVLASAEDWFFDVRAPEAQKFYCTVQGQQAAPTPKLELNFVPGIELTGTLGRQLQLEYLAQSGGWVPLAMVTLTNASQLYFDTSALGLPIRLYRLVPE